MKAQECYECGELTYNRGGICTECQQDMALWDDEDLFDETFLDDDEEIRFDADGVLRLRGSRLG